MPFIHVIHRAGGGLVVPPGVTDWVRRVLANGGAMPTQTVIRGLIPFDKAISSLKSRIYHLNVVAPDDFIAFRTPYLKPFGIDPWVKHQVGGGTSESLTVNGWSAGAGATGAQGEVYDTGVNPSAISAFTTGNCGISVYMSEATITAGNTAVCGSFNNTTTTLQLRPDQAAGSQTAMFGWDASNPTTVASSHKGGFYLGSRVSTTDLQVYFSNSTNAWASLQTIATTNTRSPNSELIAAGGCLNGAAYSCVGSARFSFMAVHDGFSSADGKILANAVQALRVAFGGGFI